MDRVGGVLVETYRIERLLAEGSMGTIYEARHLRIPKRFAVKFLRVALTESPEALQRFQREAEVVATLDHANIVTLYDYSVADDGVPFIVLEFLDGEHLAARLRRERTLVLPAALRIVDAVASALGAAHAHDVIHRDLKPENIVLCGGDAVKVVDFGVAKLRGAPELTAVNTIIGTVPYMAPEQLCGGVLDASIDQYALAAIAYEMLAGEMAFDGSGTVAEVARRVLVHQPPFIPGVAQAVNEVLFRGMARAAGDRFPSVTEFSAALREAAGGGAPELSDGRPELPPLVGEATRVTIAAAAADAAARALEDADDPLAAPPEGISPAIRMPAASLEAITDEIPLLGDDEHTAVEDPLPQEATRIVDPRGDGSDRRSRATRRSREPAAATNRGEAIAAEPTRETPLPSRTRWILVGVGVGVCFLVAMLVVWLARN